MSPDTRFAPARFLLSIVVAAGCAAAGAATLGAGPATAAGVASGLDQNAGGRNLRAPVPRMQSQSASGIQKVASFNWSGYAQEATPGTFYGVSATWKVPTVNTSIAGAQYSADWVGIGGFNDETLVQAGTEADNLGGTPRYQAWTEILPEAENPLSLAVHPGDKITTTVRETKPGKWTMTVLDTTTKQKATRTAAYTGSTHASVEAIHERPCIKARCNTLSDLAELTHTTNVTFDPGKYSSAIAVAPTMPLLSPAARATLYQIFMANDANAIIASPSLSDTDLDGFALADGAVEPAPPKS